MSRAVQTSENHYPLVDSLRGVSILVVLLLHFHLAYKLTDGIFGNTLANPILARLVRNGNYGVVMFFVISGFLITSRTLLRSGELQKISAPDFYIFRAGRILPNILLMLTLVIAFWIVGVRIFQNDPSGPSMFITIVSVLTFTHNLLMEKFGYFNYCLNILWSLSVEEVFYLTFPFLCLLAKRKWIPLSIWTALIFISPIYRFSHRNDPEDIYGLYDYLACFDGIAIGCLVAFLRNTLNIPVWTKNLVPAFLLAIGVIYFCGGIWKNLVFGISGVSIFMGLTLLTMRPAREQNRSFLPIQAIQWIGKHSYELYLFHIIILAWMKTLVSRNDVAAFGKLPWFTLYLVLSMLAAACVQRFYSEPLNRKIRIRATKALSSFAFFRNA